MTYQRVTSMKTRGSEIFAKDFREQPYWWRAASPISDVFSGRVPEKAEVVIVGGGITGLVTALDLLRGGAEVIIVDSQNIGEGAARRNAGFLGRTLKRSVEWIAGREGQEQAIKVYRELDSALHCVRTVVLEEKIDCYHNTCGRFGFRKFARASSWTGP
ncbi:FAD-binding oxidoreductase [Agrobacterium sp. S2]|nr:FAD-binding oxidoreductase [Agrobacterium sp. S2]